MGHPRLSFQRQQPGASGAGDAHLGRTPGRSHIGGANHTHHRVGPTQPLMQPLIPLPADRDPITQIPIQKHLVTFAHQPPMQSTGKLTVIVRMTDEDPGHVPPRCSSRCVRP